VLRIDGNESTLKSLQHLLAVTLSFTTRLVFDEETDSKNSESENRHEYQRRSNHHDIFQHALYNVNAPYFLLEAIGS